MTYLDIVKNCFSKHSNPTELDTVMTSIISSYHMRLLRIYNMHSQKTPMSLPDSKNGILMLIWTKSLFCFDFVNIKHYLCVLLSNCSCKLQWIQA